MEYRSRLHELFETGKFVVTAEIGPPRSADGENVRKKARALRGIVDAANVTDNPTAVVRMSSIAATCIAQSEGIETVVQMTCRDRNRIAMQSDLMGAYALGQRNLLCLSGDHQSLGDDPQTKSVYDLDSIQFVRAATDLSNGVFVNGKACKIPPKFFVGAVANPFADPEELQFIRLYKKADAGARFIQTQSIYDVDRFERWMEEVRKAGLHKRLFIEAGVFVNKTLRSIQGTAKVPGIVIPKQLIDRMRKAEEQSEEGIRIALETIERVRGIEGVSGVHIMAVGWESVVPTIVERAGLLPRPKTDSEVQ